MIQIKAGCTMFEDIKIRGVDNLLALMEKFRNDPREQKVDLVVGVYKDDHGDVPVMRAVKQAENHLFESEKTKNYVGIPGDAEFRALVPSILLGSQSPLIEQNRIDCVQTPGGTGALKVACDLLNYLKPAIKIWVSTPTWANHIPVATDARLTVDQYPYFRSADRSLDFDGMMTHLDEHSKAGEVILLHACCHNPTGVDLTLDQWQQLTDFVRERQLFPLVDCAYQGLGDGMDADVAGLRHMTENLPELLIANSFSKNFGIYRERTGALSFVCESAEQVTNTFNAVKTVIRSNYSMPPSHGARVVATVLNDSQMTAEWKAELDEMRSRISAMRSALRSELEQRGIKEDLSFLTNQKGMFSYTGFTPEMVASIKDNYGIYMAGDGRINVAGICSGNLDYISDAFASVLD